MKRLAPLTCLLCLSTIVGLSTFARPAHAVTASFSVVSPGSGTSEFTCTNTVTLSSAESSWTKIVWQGRDVAQTDYFYDPFVIDQSSILYHGGTFSLSYAHTYATGAWNFHCDDRGAAAGTTTGWYLHIDKSVTLY